VNAVHVKSAGTGYRERRNGGEGCSQKGHFDSGRIAGCPSSCNASKHRCQ
jgi:hypothetical protein